MIEVWRPIAGYEGRYDVSNLGRVRSLSRRTAKDGRMIEGKILSPSSHRWGHQSISLYDLGGREKRFGVHRLVLEAFNGPCPEGMEGCHDDGNPSNNRIENLRWDTPKNNHADKYRHGTILFGERNTSARITAEIVGEIFQLRIGGMRVHRIGELFGLSKQHVSDILNRKRWQHVDTGIVVHKRTRRVA
jgi:hypothetical protein